MEPPRPERSRSRAAWALLVSLLLHLAVAWWFARGRPPPAAPGHEQPPPIEVQVIQLPAPAPAPASPPAPVRVPKRSSPAQVAQGPAQPEHEPAAPGAPERIDLLPPPSRLPGPAGPGGSGRTITNRPQTSEEHAGAVAEEAGRVKDRVDGWLAADQGRHQVAMGLVDPYFGQVRGALQAAVERGLPDGMPGRNVGQQLIDSVLSGASSFGKTGNPYGEGQVPNAEPAEREFGPARETARRYQGSDPTKGSYGDVPIHGLSSEQMQQCIDQGKLLDDFLSGKFGDGLTAVVELSQAPDGSVQGVRLVATSGLPAYDRHVLGVAPSALEHLPPPPEKGFGIKPGGLKSLWAFEGRVKFKRPLKEWNPLTGSLTGTLVGALYGLACPGLGPPVTFDAATGELELIDLAHPKFTCKVKLVRVE